MRRVPLAALLLVVVAFGGEQVGQQLSPSVARAIDIEAVIWQFAEDYPGADGNDANLPLQTVYVKTHDGTDWMSAYDEHPKAVHGPFSVRRLIDDYHSQGIEVVAWFVPKGTDIDEQLRMAEQVLSTGVKALYADIEPFDGFCYTECAYLAEQFWWRLRADHPEANLGVIYDPRPWTWGDSATALWLAAANAALPMCYWEDYVDQGKWSDPAGCVGQARADLELLAPGRSLEFIPMLQGNTSAERFVAAVEAARIGGSSKVSVWRRGVVSGEVWQAAWGVWEPAPVVASTWPGYWQWSPCPWDGCILREVSSPAQYILYSGAKFHISSPEALAAMGRSPWDFWYVDDGLMGTVAEIPWDGTLLREAGSDGVWVVYGGARFPVPSPEAQYALGLGAQPVHVIPPGGLNQIPLVPADGTRLRELSSEAEWQVAAGAKFPLASPEVADQLVGAGALRADVYVVADGALAQIPVVPRDGSRVREMNSGAEWQIAAGAKFQIADAVERNKLVRAGQLEWRLIVVPDGALAGVPTMPPEGGYIRELSENREWQIAGGLKFWIRDAGRRTSLQAGGHLAGELKVVPDGALAGVAEGPQEGTLLKEPDLDTIFVLLCGSLYRVADQVQIDRLVALGLARLPVLTVSGPLAEPSLEERGRCTYAGEA